MFGACTAHEGTNLPSAVFDTRILQSKKGQLDEFASCHYQRFAILVSDTELYVVESVDVLEECASGLGRGPVMKGIKTRTVGSRIDAAGTHEMPSSLSAGNDSYASC